MAGPHAHGTVWGWGRGLGQCATRASAFRSQVALGWQGSWLRSPARILAAKSGVTCRPSSAMTPVTPSVSGTLVSEGCCNAAPRKVTFARAARRVHHVRKWGEGGVGGGWTPGVHAARCRGCQCHRSRTSPHHLRRATWAFCLWARSAHAALVACRCAPRQGQSLAQPPDRVASSGRRAGAQTHPWTMPGP